MRPVYEIQTTSMPSQIVVSQPRLIFLSSFGREDEILSNLFQDLVKSIIIVDALLPLLHEWIELGGQVIDPERETPHWPEADSAVGRIDKIH